MGVFTFIFTLNAGLMMAAFNQHVVLFLLPCAGLSGLAADLLYLLYFLNLAIVGPTFFQSGITWSVHFWAGSFVLAGIFGFLLSYVMIPPSKPCEKQEEPVHEPSLGSVSS